MNTYLLILLGIWIASLIGVISIFVISNYIEKIKNKRFVEWWNKNISHLLNPDDPRF